MLRLVISLVLATAVVATPLRAQELELTSVGKPLLPDTLNTVRQGGQASIPPEGGTVTLEGIGSITFPAGAFSEAQTVELDTIVSAFQLLDFDQIAMAGSAGPDARASYVIRVLAGAVPATRVQVALTVPDELLGPESRFALFAKYYTVGFGGAVIDHYRGFLTEDREFDPESNVFTATLPGSAFSSSRRPDGRAELLMIIAVGFSRGAGGAPH